MAQGWGGIRAAPECGPARRQVGADGRGGRGAARFGAGRAPGSALRPPSRPRRAPSRSRPARAATAAAGEATSRAPATGGTPAPPPVQRRAPRPWKRWLGCCLRSCCSARSSTAALGKRAGVRAAPGVALGGEYPRSSSPPPIPRVYLPPPVFISSVDSRLHPPMSTPISPLGLSPPPPPPRLPRHPVSPAGASLRTHSAAALGARAVAAPAPAAPGAVRRPGAEPAPHGGTRAWEMLPFLPGARACWGPRPQRHLAGPWLAGALPGAG